MAVFAVLPRDPTPKLDAAIRAELPDDSLQLANNQWLVSFRGTAVSLSEKLGVTDGANGAAVIVQVGSYYGRTSRDVWDWIKEKLEAPNA